MPNCVLGGFGFLVSRRVRLAQIVLRALIVVDGFRHQAASRFAGTD